MQHEHIRGGFSSLLDLGYYELLVDFQGSFSVCVLESEVEIQSSRIISDELQIEGNHCLKRESTVEFVKPTAVATDVKAKLECF